MQKLRNVTLELSIKPFYDESEAVMREVGRKMFRQWRDLTDCAEAVSLMLLIGDGAEILTYSGDPDQTFEWGYWHGCAEALPPPEPATALDRRRFHYFPSRYRSDARPRSYRWLRRLIEVLRECCMEVNGKPLRVVILFDNGPEFAISPFKYQWHPEICQGSTVGHHKSVVCNAHLHADSRRYAAYPDGIPEGTPLGRFLGKQFRCFSRDTGVDALWLSNGMGFGRDPWGITGFLFDKQQFFPERAAGARSTMLEFWEELTAACPGLCIETRGSNFSAGVELASDGAPLQKLYERFRIAPPVNSPWAALNYNTGLEIAAWMSHVAELPDHRFPYRFYIHDPWFLNSPWIDRYGREPWDVYLPLSVSRITADGSVQTPDGINLLSVDDSWGQLPDLVPQEVTPHLLEAFRTAPDAPAPFVWVYPFRRYCAMVHGGDPHPETVFNEDLFLGETIQAGFPLNTVVELGNVGKLPPSSIAVIPVSAYNEEVEAFLSAGGRAIFYGSLERAPEALKTRLGLTCGEGRCGELTVTQAPDCDQFREDGYARSIFVHPLYDGGALTEAAAGAKVLAAAGDRVLASIHGQTAFLRAVLPLGPEIGDFPQLDKVDALHAYPVEVLLRAIAAEFGWTLGGMGWNGGTRLPRFNLSRHRNMFYCSVFARDTTAVLKLRTPLGAPILDEMETELEDGCALWHPGKCWHKRCRVLVDQTAPGVISQKIETHEEPYLHSRLGIYGLKEATVRIFLPEETLSHLEFVDVTQGGYYTEPRLPYQVEQTELGPCAVLRKFSGDLHVGVYLPEGPHAVSDPEF